MNQIVTSQPHAPSRSSWKSEIPRAQRKLVWKFFVLRKIGYVRSQVESVAWNAPLVQFISLFLQQNYRKIILLLAKNSSHATQKKHLPSTRSSQHKRLFEKIAFFCYTTTAIIFQLQILHLIKYKCIFAFIYDGCVGGRVGGREEKEFRCSSC